ncbi:hypothetical protein ABE485_29060 [Achromobacter spanius]|uniref:hypothetical protein n=1 Tax=Achromobacter spanius TaxID=217203 RepID=UPI003207D117
MNSCLRLHYQRQLIYAGIDDFTPNGVFLTYIGGRDSNNVREWQREVVAFLEAGAEHGLLRVMNWNELFSSSVPVNIERYLLGGASIQDFNLNESVVWNSLYFFGTENFIEDMELLGLRTWDALVPTENKKFLKFIQEKYRVDLGL